MLFFYYNYNLNNLKKVNINELKIYNIFSKAMLYNKLLIKTKIIKLKKKYSILNLWNYTLKFTKKKYYDILKNSDNYNYSLFNFYDYFLIYHNISDNFHENEKNKFVFNKIINIVHKKELDKRIENRFFNLIDLFNINLSRKNSGFVKIFCSLVCDKNIMVNNYNNKHLNNLSNQNILQKNNLSYLLLQKYSLFKYLINNSIFYNDLLLYGYIYNYYNKFNNFFFTSKHYLHNIFVKKFKKKIINKRKNEQTKILQDIKKVIKRDKHINSKELVFLNKFYAHINERDKNVVGFIPHKMPTLQPIKIKEYKIRIKRKLRYLNFFLSNTKMNFYMSDKKGNILFQRNPGVFGFKHLKKRKLNVLTYVLEQNFMFIFNNKNKENFNDYKYIIIFNHINSFFIFQQVKSILDKIKEKIYFKGVHLKNNLNWNTFKKRKKPRI